jgi:hypothetical protein
MLSWYRLVEIIDEVADLGFEVTGQELVLEQHPVLHRLMPALDSDDLGFRARV